MSAGVGTVEHMFESWGDGPESMPDAPAAGLLAALVSGVATAADLQALMALDRSVLSHQESLMALEILERFIASCHAMQAELLVQLAGPSKHETRVPLSNVGSGGPGGQDPSVPAVIVIEELVREEIASLLHWSSGQTQRRIDAARLLTSTLPATLTSLRSGQISHPHAVVVAEAAQRLPGAGAVDAAGQGEFARLCALLEDATIPVAQVSTVARTRRVADRVAVTVDAVEPQERERRRRLAHEVFVWAEGDGTATLSARMNAEHARACMAAINAMARDPRLSAPCDASIGHRRSLALATLVINGRVPVATEGPPGASGWSRSDERRPAGEGSAAPCSAGRSNERSTASVGALTDSSGGGSPAAGNDANGPGNAEGEELIGPRPRVHLDIVISLDSLMGLTADHAVVGGAGLMPAHLVRGMLADATMRRLVTDPMTGHLLDLGRRRYRVSDGLREFIEARDRTCRFPGCDRRATDCQMDHAIPWEDGGATGPGNVGALCTRHHQVKTHGGWRIDAADSSGSCTWRSPLGRIYSRAPEPVLPAVGWRSSAGVLAEPLPDPPAR